MINEEINSTNFNQLSNYFAAFSSYRERLIEMEVAFKFFNIGFHIRNPPEMKSCISPVISDERSDVFVSIILNGASASDVGNTTFAFGIKWPTCLQMHPRCSSETYAFIIHFELWILPPHL